MNNENIKDIIVFENFLRDIISKSQEINPLTDDEIIQLLDDSETTIEIEENEVKRMVQLIKEIHDRKKHIEGKLENKASIRSLGELIRIICEYNSISVDRLAAFIDLTCKEMDDYIQDKRSPLDLGKVRILNLSIIFKIGIQEIISIIERTIKLMTIKSADLSMSAGYTRADKDLSDSKRDNIMNDAMKELLLAVEEPEHEYDSSSDWSDFKQDLQAEASNEKSYEFNTDGCFTIISSPAKLQLKKQFLDML